MTATSVCSICVPRALLQFWPWQHSANEGSLMSILCLLGHVLHASCWATRVHEQVVESSILAGTTLAVHVADSDAFPSLCCHYCQLSNTTYDEMWDWRVLDACPLQLVRPYSRPLTSLCEDVDSMQELLVSRIDHHISYNVRGAVTHARISALSACRLSTIVHIAVACTHPHEQADVCVMDMKRQA